MKCSRCGGVLESIRYEDVDIETCPGCGGEWLDKGGATPLDCVGSEITTMFDEAGDSSGLALVNAVLRRFV